MTNKNNTVLYIGITSSLVRRNFEHKNKIDKNSFSAKYNINKLVYYELCYSPTDAISIEKKVKKWKREWKNNLIEKNNPGWKDLFDEMEFNDI